MPEIKKFTRTFNLQALTREEGEEPSKDGFRRVRATLSTDQPYKRWPDGFEVLVHGKNNVNTERLDDGFPILYNHMRAQIVGKLNSYELSDDRLEVDMEIGGSSVADDVIRMLDAGILSKMSVSYEYDWDNTSVEEVGDEEYVVRLMKWMPIEGSFVSIPADNNCDVTSVREHLTEAGKLPEEAKPEAEEKAEEEGETKSPDPTPQSASEGDVAPEDSTTEETEQMSDNANAVDTAEIVKLERERSAALSKLARDNAIDAATEQRWIAEGTDAGAAALEVVDILNKRKADEAAAAEKAKAEQTQPQANPQVTYDTKVDAPMPQTQERKYSLYRALIAESPQSLDGVEAEVHQELRRKRIAEKRNLSSNSVLVPGYELARIAFQEGKRHMPPQARKEIQEAIDAERAYAERQGNIVLGTATGTDTSATALNPDELIPSAFIEMLRNYSNLGELGVTMLEGLVGDVKLPRQTGKENWEYASASTGVSDHTGNLAKTQTPAFGDLSLSMKTAYARQGITRAALMNTTPAVFSLVVNSVIVGASETLQDTLINGDGSTGKPTGILGTTGISSVNIGTAGGTDGGIAKLRNTHLIDAEAKLRASNVFRPNSMETGKWLVPGAAYSELEGTTRFDQTSVTLINDGRLGTSPVAWWNGMPADKGIYGNWSDALIGVWGDSIEFRTADHENGGVVLSAYMDHDIKLRHAVSFVQVRQTPTG